MTKQFDELKTINSATGRLFYAFMEKNMADVGRHERGDVKKDEKVRLRICSVTTSISINRGIPEE